QRGTLPPLVDANGREITEDAASRLALANIDPVFNLPGKNSADVRIARDVLSDAGHHDAADVYILASGDRDFNDVLNTLVKQSSSVVVWGVRGSTSRMLENNSALTVEYIEDFTDLQTHQSLNNASPTDDNFVAFTPSQWTSIIIQFDRLTVESDSDSVSIRQL
ncbi:MAG TPA: NYN domain-containing protein, partial [Aggregatilineales bacterium]|nr:NYN domain-containing protein [Aggregatilineales bacterium]